MSRKEASNTFSEGLIKDLNPINTPNTALTDCLNGTVITYNGNEFSLQNDMGNCPLTYCKLKENYIPVGVKEYGDILYIVSYNPLDEHVEIGSYPSPETITDGLDTSGLTQTIPNIFSEIISPANYMDISKTYEQLKVFYGNNPERCKLNPGDMYKLVISSNSNNSYEGIEYYIVDENRKLYDISDKIQVGDTDLHYVEWDVPGWLAIKRHMAALDDFKVNVKSMVLPPYEDTATMQFNFQAITSDPLFVNNSSSVSNLKASVEITIKDGNTIVDSLQTTVNLSSLINEGNGNTIFFNNWSPRVMTAHGNSIITIKVTPKLVSSKTVNYDNLEKTLVFNAALKGDPSKFTVGEDSWWYRVNSNQSNPNLILKFNTGGLAEASVLNTNVYLFYSLYRLNSNATALSLVKKADGTYYQNVQMIEWDMIGDTAVEFPLEVYSQGADLDKLLAEDVYIIEFNFYTTEVITSASTPLKTIRKLITATELMNDMEEINSCYDKISFDKWISKYPNSVIDKNFIVESSVVDESSLVTDTEVTKGAVGDIWWNVNTNLGDDYRYCKDYTKYGSKLKEGFDASAGVSCSTIVSYKSDVKVLTGPLWNDLISHMTVQSTLQNSINKTLNQYSGKLNSQFEDTLSAKVKKYMHFGLHLIGDGPRNIWKYDKQSLVSSHEKDLQLILKGITTKDWTFSQSYYINNFDSQEYKLFSKTIKDRSDYTEPGNQLHLSTDGNMTPLLNIFSRSNYDIAYIPIKLHGEGSNRYENSTLYGEPNTEYLRVSSSSSNWEVDSNDSYFAAIKMGNRLGFIPIGGSDPWTSFQNWKASVSHIISDPNSEIIGGFYEASTTGGINTDSSGRFVISGKLIPTSFKFKGIDLLSSARNTLIPSGAAVVSANNFIAKSNVSALEEIQMEQLQDSINIPVNIGSSIESLLEGFASSVVTRNSTINNQYRAMESDKIYTSGYYDSSSNCYIYNDGNSDTLLKIMSGSYGLFSSNRLIFQTENVSYEHNLFGVVTLGLIDTSFSLIRSS